MSQQYRSNALGAIHETMEGLHKVAAIDRRVMQEFDERCLASLLDEAERLTAGMEVDLDEELQDDEGT